MSVKKTIGVNFRHGIARRFIFHLFWFTSLITILTTALQLFTDYSRDISHIKERMNQIESSYLQAMITSLWVFDEELLKVQLAGICQLPDIQYAKIERGGKVIFSSGSSSSKKIILRQYPMFYEYKNKKVVLGTLSVGATLDGVYQRLIDTLLVIFAIKAVRSFLLSIFLFFIFYILVGKHLSSIASYTKSVSLNKPQAPLTLGRKSKSTTENDELELLVVSINEMRLNLSESFQNIEKVNRQLQQDVTKRKLAEDKIKTALGEKEIMLKEIHHRVKNNLQVISSLLNLQSRYIKDEATLAIFSESRNRVRSMALIHEKLYQTKNFSNVDFSDYARDLSGQLFRAHNISQDLVSFEMDLEDIFLGIDVAVPCGLIINELLTNALKHAFPYGRQGTITLQLRSQKTKSKASQTKKLVLSVNDDGVGLPEGFNIKRTKTLGMQLVKTLTEQIDGVLKIKSDTGACFTIIFDSIIKDHETFENMLSAKEVMRPTLV